MKCVILVGDGMPDLPIKELNGKTPLEEAQTKNMDFAASKGFAGMVDFIPSTLPPGSDVANLSLFGYDPLKYYTGRGPLEAASMGINLKENDIAFRCNLVNIENGLMKDYSAGHISTEEAKEIIKELNLKLSDHNIKFYPGVSYRHLCVIKNGPLQIECIPPHDITGKKVEEYLPKGEEESLLIDLMKKSERVLRNCNVNRKREKEDLLPATSTWLWGQGKKPDMPKFDELYNLSGSVITAVDLIKGIGIYAGLDVINVPGATGYLDTNYKGKAEYALESLKIKDFVFVHIEAPDEAGHSGDLKGKIKAIEDFDKLVVGPILEGLKKHDDFRLLITSDHQTPLSLKTHVRGFVPFVIIGGPFKKNGAEKFSEKDIKKTGVKVEAGYTLISKLLGKE